MKFFNLLFRRQDTLGPKTQVKIAQRESGPRRDLESADSPSRVVDLRSPDFIQAQEDAAARGAKVGDMHVGFRLISVKDGALDHVSIVLAENVNASVSAKYVVWTLIRKPGGGYTSGTYVGDRAVAQRVFDSRDR